MSFFNGEPITEEELKNLLPSDDASREEKKKAFIYLFDNHYDSCEEHRHLLIKYEDILMEIADES